MTPTRLAAPATLLVTLCVTLTCAHVHAQAPAQPQVRPQQLQQLQQLQQQQQPQPPARPPTYSANSLYNLGNAYARAGKPGMAVLNYERASLLAPDDTDIEANLRFVRDAAKVPSTPPTWFERTFTGAHPTPLYWTGLIGIIFGGSCLLTVGTTPARRWGRRLGTAAGISLVGVTACSGWVTWPRLHEAVVLTSATPARVAPVPMGDPLFTLREAETVSITAKHEGFVLIQTRAGKTGWVADADLAPVVPELRGFESK